MLLQQYEAAFQRTLGDSRSVVSTVRKTLDAAAISVPAWPSRSPRRKPSPASPVCSSTYTASYPPLQTSRSSTQCVRESPSPPSHRPHDIPFAINRSTIQSSRLRVYRRHHGYGQRHTGLDSDKPERCRYVRVPVSSIYSVD